MSDYSDRYTDKKISAVDRELKRTYRTAQIELKRKLADFNKRFAQKSREKKQQVKDGKITEQEYKDWLTGQVFVRNQWQSQINAVNSVLLDHNKQAIKIINNGTLDVFAESYNFNAFRAESMIAASFTVYNAESVARLILGDPQLLPEWKINEKKDYAWNYDKVNNIVRQAIIQGKGVEEITGELCDRLSTTNESKMRMFARTALGSAQNAGRQKQMEDAAAMGIEVNKQWEAAHDSKTRDSHRALDGEEVPYDEEFSNGLMFPKDPTGAPEEVYNCRCTMKTIYPKYEDRSKPNWREEEVIDGESYRDWKKFDNYNDWKKWKEETGQVKGKPGVSYPDDDIMKEYGKTKKTSFREAERDTNPKFGTDVAYSKNCANCVVANEMRQRGYDVVAGVADSKIRSYWWDGKGKITTGKGSWTDCFEGITRENVGAKRKEQQIPLIEEKVKAWGNGARGVVYVKWDAGNGHYFSVENVNGEVRFSNPQNNEVDAKGFFEYSRPSKTDIFRLDTLKPTEYIKKVVEKNEK